ncbi:MAG: hypothetical protein R2991_06315 [Thermoanaerobaculia bacterium]
MRPALQTRWRTGLLLAACLAGAALSLREAPAFHPPQPVDWVERYGRLRAALPQRGDVVYFADPALESSDRTGYFRAQYVVTPTVLHFETDPERLFRRKHPRPVLLDFVAPPDRRVAATIGRARRAAAQRGIETRLVKLGDSLFLVVAE